MRKTIEQKEWLISNFNNYPNYNLLTESFNEKFGTNIRMSGIYTFLKNNKLIKRKNESYNLADCELKFLRDNIHKLSFEKLTNSFNVKFGKRYSRRRIEHICFKNGFYRNGKDLPIGSETLICNGKYTLIKVSEEKERSERWKLKHRKVYEDFFGEIPDGKVVFFLDGNTHNFDISNLYLTEKRIVYLLKNNKWITNDIELNLTMLKWCELYYSLKDKEKESENNQC